MRETIFDKCLETDCPNPGLTKGLCPKHYSRALLGSSPLESDTSPMPVCSVSHCGLPANARKEGALCEPHYQKQWRGKDPEDYVPTPKTEVCWKEGCQKLVETKGLCKSHYNKAKQGKFEVPASLGVKLNPPCSFKDCDYLAESIKRGLCHSHWLQETAGKPLTPLRTWGDYATGGTPCDVLTCSKPAIIRGMCRSHDKMRNKYKLQPDELMAILSIDTCENPSCDNTENLHIDHDHATGIVRGRLCSGCNTSLGMLKENPARIEGLARYARTHGR